VPNDLFCLSVGSTIIADCGASTSGGAKTFTDGQRSGASGDPASGRVWAQTSEALITASAHRDKRTTSRKGLYPPHKWAKLFQEHTTRKTKREEGERESC